MSLDLSSAYAGVLDIGNHLAETSVEEGGWKEYFTESDKADMRIADVNLRATTALLLENAKRWMSRMCRKPLDGKGRLQVDEATRSALVGGFSDYLYPLIRASFPTNPINDLVAVQPTTRRVSTLVHWNWIVGKGKGSYTQGQRLFDANRGKQDIGFNFSNEVIDSEATPALGSAGATYTGTLKFADGGGVRPGTVAITVTTTTNGAKVFYDDAAGGFRTPSALTISSATIDYKSGTYTIVITGDTFTTAAGTATYRWDSEGSNSVPEVDVQIITSTVETERRALVLNYSMESAYDVMTEFGVVLEPALVSGASEQLNYEIARQIVHELWMAAPVVDTFTLTPPSTQYNQQDHFKDIVFVLNKASNSIQSKTQKGYGNFVILDEGASNIVESLPSGMFVAAPRPANVQGLHFIGTLLGRYRVYKDLYLSKEPGSSAYGNILMGFKGTQFFEAGFVYSPYQLMYTSDTLQTANMMNQKGMASRYATKMVNRDMYIRVNIGA